MEFFFIVLTLTSCFSGLGQAFPVPLSPSSVSFLHQPTGFHYTSILNQQPQLGKSLPSYDFKLIILYIKSSLSVPFGTHLHGNLAPTHPLFYPLGYHQPQLILVQPVEPVTTAPAQKPAEEKETEVPLEDSVVVDSDPLKEELDDDAPIPPEVDSVEIESNPETLNEFENEETEKNPEEMENLERNYDDSLDAEAELNETEPLASPVNENEPEEPWYELKSEKETWCIEHWNLKNK